MVWSNVTSSDIQGEHVWRFIDLCETVIKTYGALINRSYQNTELHFSYIDCLSDYIHSIRISKDAIVQKYLKRAEQEWIDPKTVDTQPVIAQVEELCTLLDSIVCKGWLNKESFFQGVYKIIWLKRMWFISFITWFCNKGYLYLLGDPVVFILMKQTEYI